MKNFTFIDRFINRFRIKGIWIYTSLVLFSTFYTFYNLRKIESIDKTPGSKPKKDFTRPNRDESHHHDSKVCSDNCHDLKQISSKLHHLHQGETGVKIRHDDNKAVVAKDQVHIVDTWDKQQLFSYLIDYRIFPDIDADLDQVRAQAKQIYDNI